MLLFSYFVGASLMKDNFYSIFKYVLDNGLAVLACPIKNVPKVSVQLWYGVGSKNEYAGQRGLAHFLEHMIFKGTHKLSESDIPLITNKLSGSCNAFTSQDYTGYLFDFPSQNWHEALILLSDCMKNCTFKQELFNAELKTVIQELKMYRDDFDDSLVEQMVAAIFSGHPYHHPVIGYKQDILSLRQDSLIQFYKKYYVPNNAALVLVGDIDPDGVVTRAKETFGFISADNNYKQEFFSADFDMSSKSVTLYRDIQQPIVQFAFVIPGASRGLGYLADAAAWILCNGRGSRLYKKLVNELLLVTELEAFVDDLFDYGLFFIKIRPKNITSIEQIELIILDEIDDIKKNGISAQELQRAKKKMRVEQLSLFEDYQELAYEIGKHYTAAKNEKYVMNYFNQLEGDLKKRLEDFFSDYFRPISMHRGSVLPLPQDEKERWIIMQAREDQEDERILSTFVRAQSVEPGQYVNKVVAQDPKLFPYPQPESCHLENGLKVLFYNNSGIKMIELALDLKAKYFFDPKDQQGLALFVSRMMLEGTKKYTWEELAQQLESRGMAISIVPGFVTMSMLKSDFLYGLELLQEILCNPTFDETSLEKIRAQMQADLEDFWDRPSVFVMQLAREQIYRGHQYSKNQFGTKKSLSQITKDDLIDFHQKYISPQGATLSLVGNLDGYNVQDIVGKTLGFWEGLNIHDINFPELIVPERKTINYEIKRDQVVLCYAGLSVKRMDAEYDRLLVFDQIFTGGVTGSLSSRLFQIREETGLFYTIGGSVVLGASRQPGMIGIKTIVSLDSLAEAENIIEKAIINATKNISDQEFIDARNSIINSLVGNFESNTQTAVAFLFLERYGLPKDYFDKRAEQILQIEKEQMIQVVKKFLLLDDLIKIRVGRV